MTEQEVFRTFATRWADTADAVADVDVEELEGRLSVYFPGAYRRFVRAHGTPFCPALLDAIVESGRELHDVQQFLPTSEIAEASAAYQAAGMQHDFIGFATDCTGNMFLFRTIDCGPRRDDAAVWFFDHDLGSIEEVAPSFVAWLSELVSLDPTSIQLTQ